MSSSNETRADAGPVRASDIQMRATGTPAQRNQRTLAAESARRKRDLQSRIAAIGRGITLPPDDAA